jgi:L-lactate permease
MATQLQNACCKCTEHGKLSIFDEFHAVIMSLVGVDSNDVSHYYIDRSCFVLFILFRIFCFAYMVEGASGFGTPVALGAPMLISTGHPKKQSVVTLLIFNTFATVWGAVGTPIWFGFGNLELTESEFLDISFKAAICLLIGSYILVPLTLLIIVPWPLIKKNVVFIFLSLLVCVGPSTAIAFVSYEFPSLMGGLVGCCLTAVLIQYRVGLSPLDPADMPERDPREIGTVSERSIVAEYYASLKEQEEAEDDGEIAATEKKLAGAEDSSSEEKPKSSNGDVGEEKPPVKSADGVEISASGTAAEADADEDPAIEKADTGEDSEIRPDAERVASVEDFVDQELGPRKPFGMEYVMELIGRTFPIWGVVFLLIITRVPQIGIKQYLQLREPYFEIFFNTYGVFRLSASLVFQLNNILTYPNLNWRYELLYTPFVIPFVLISVITMVVYRRDMGDTKPRNVFGVVAGRLVNPFIALLGALALVQLLIRIDTAAPAYIIGTTLSDWFRQGFVVIAPLLGALGSFFSGSTTVSNLTFGAIQVIAAESIGISKTSMLALQIVGASAGNGICLNNIISACTITGLQIGEGEILGQTYKYVFSNTTIATIIMLAFFIRFN